jgi:hypothetical protein
MAENDSARAEQILSPVTWGEVKDAELDDALGATPAQRLAWLEEAMRLAWAAGSADHDESVVGGQPKSRRKARPDPV